MSETSFTKELTAIRRSEIKRENSVTISPLVEQRFLVIYFKDVLMIDFTGQKYSVYMTAF